MKIDPADYTANKWREIIAKPDTLVGFGKPGDWYQYVLQQRSMLSFYEGLDESSGKVNQTNKIKSGSQTELIYLFLSCSFHST
jgi:hypothetical protein